MHLVAATESPPPNTLPNDVRLRQAAEGLEASFLAEMLKSAGVGAPRDEFGGGEGEDQFSSFLVREYAEATVRAGGIGLAETIYQALLRAEEVPQ